MRKVTVNRETCIACGSCYLICAEVFEGESDGKSKVNDQYLKEQSKNYSTGEIPEELENCANEAAEACPTQSIEVV